MVTPPPELAPLPTEPKQLVPPPSVPANSEAAVVRVFLSYSDEDPAHRALVLDLAQRLLSPIPNIRPIPLSSA